MCLVARDKFIFGKSFVGDFYQRPKQGPVIGERSRPIRQEDNLHPEGDFYDRPQHAAPLKGDRADIKKPIDNLKPEGTFINSKKISGMV